MNHNGTNVVSPARQICFRILSQIESGYVFSDDALNSEIMNTVDVRDRNLITEIVYGTLRRRNLLDYVLAKASSRPWQSVAAEAKILLRMSLYQMWYMDRIPDHALVHDAVELAKHFPKRGIDRYLNGMLRCLSRERPWTSSNMIEEAPPWIKVSLPRWLWKRWVRRFGENIANEYADSLNGPPNTALRLNESFDTRHLSLKVRSSDIVPGAYILCEEASKKKRSTMLHFQDEASQLIPHLLGNIQGQKLWDSCAAPGGKTAILRHNAGESGLVVASDISMDRIRHQQCSQKHTVKCAEKLLVADAGFTTPFRIDFDAVIADVPCSGLGTLRRNPEIKWRFRSSNLSQLQENQLKILNNVSENVRAGGKLLYSTCSTEPEENEQVVERFLETHEDFRLERPSHPAGIDIWTGSDAMVRTFPSARRWDGFFAALMVRYS